MNAAEYGTMFELESFYWWFVARRKLLNDLMAELRTSPAKTKLLDVGCGTGLNLSVLAKYGTAFGADTSPDALKYGASRGYDSLVLSNAEKLDFDEASFDVVTALDVLEHTDNDCTALKEVLRVLKPEGWLIVTVPAYGFLWTEHDEALHHRRRYTSHELRNKMTNAGFDMRRCTYFITLLFFPIFFLRFAQSLTKKSIEPKTSHMILPGWLNALLVRLLDVERWMLRWINLPFGVSVVAVARKPAAMNGPTAKPVEPSTVASVAHDDSTRALSKVLAE